MVIWNVLLWLLPAIQMWAKTFDSSEVNSLCIWNISVAGQRIKRVLDSGKCTLWQIAACLQNVIQSTCASIKMTERTSWVDTFPLQQQRHMFFLMFDKFMLLSERRKALKHLLRFKRVYFRNNCFLLSGLLVKVLEKFHQSWPKPELVSIKRQDPFGCRQFRNALWEN